MALVVQKYGGTSVGNLDKIANVAKKVIRTKEEGNDVVVVLSAMSGETDRLIQLAQKATDEPEPREYDSLISTGEQVTVTLLAIMLNGMGYPAKSFLGFQVRVLTDQAFKKARILSVDTEAIRAELKKGTIVVVAGFQGIDRENNITTLGRGGSDTSAVALAAALKADVCDIYTDVDGVYTTDPNICSNARRLDRITYDEMLEMARAGAKVLHPRSVELAKKYNVPVFSSSALRFVPQNQKLNRGEYGKVLGADCYSPAPSEPSHPDFSWYGIHGVETLFTVMGTGCVAVNRMSSEGTDVVVGLWDDGRIGTFRGRRPGNNMYGGTVFCEKETIAVGGYQGYGFLLEEILKFFKTRIAPVSEKETLEIFTFMEASNESKGQKGKIIYMEDAYKKGLREAKKMIAKNKL